MLFIFCCVYVKRVPSYYQPEQNPWASKFQSWNPSPLWCCKMINATEVTRLEMILQSPTEGELWHFSVGLWAEEVGDFHCKLPPFFFFFFCRRSRPSLPLLRNVIPCHFSFWVLKLDLPTWLGRLNFQIQVGSPVYRASRHFPSPLFDWQLSSETV